MKIFLIFSILFFTQSVLHNMHKYGYGINDAFWRVIWSIDEETIWAKGFSEENFSKLKYGMSSRRVLELLGPPLYKNDNCEHHCFWYYTRQARGNADFDQRWVVFNLENKVKEIRKSFFID